MNGYRWTWDGFVGTYGGVSGTWDSIHTARVSNPSETITHLEMPGRYNMVGAYSHAFSVSINHFQLSSSVVDELTFHRPMTFNYLFADGSVRAVNLWTAWGGGPRGMWDRIKN